MTTTQQEITPKLRYPEFKGNWNQATIGEHFEFKNGLNKEKKYFGTGTPIINFMDVYKLTAMKKNDIKGLVSLNEKEINRYSAKKGDVFFTRTSETIHDIGMSSTLVEDIHDCVFSGFVLRARPTSSYFYEYFTSHCFNTNTVRKEIIRKSSYTTRALTSGTLLKKVTFSFPISVKEQQKIASFLSSMDKRIEQLQKKISLLEQYKKGMVQKLFTQELRFKDNQGSDYPVWDNMPLNTLFRRITTKNKINIKNVLTISAKMGLVSQTDYFNHLVAAKDLTGYYLLEKGDFAYNKSYSKGYPMGAIKRLKKYQNGVVSTLYICFRAIEKESVMFYEKLFESGYQNHWIHKIAQEGARNHGLLNMAVGDFFNIPLPVPHKEEQQKIANFLTSIDNKIELVGAELEKSQTFKKGLLQQMFV